MSNHPIHHCDQLGICQGHRPPCAGCTVPEPDDTPTPPPSEWLSRLPGAIAFAATLAAAVTAIAVLIARQLPIG